MTAVPAQASVPGERCALAARARDDSMAATALPVSRFVMLEVPGAWVPEVWKASGLPGDIARLIGTSADVLRARVVLIRRPGRHPAAPEAGRRWGVASREGVRWGSWSSPLDLLTVDLAAEFAALTAGTASAAQPPAKPLVLVCTHGRHDLCCAVDGRPVADLLDEDESLDVWECSHLGGDRFAANLVVLPQGWMLGGLSPANARELVTAATGPGRVSLPFFRGQCGEPAIAQAAHHILMESLGEDRPDAVTMESIDGLDVVAVHQGVRYVVTLQAGWTQPHHLTCRAPGQARMKVFSALGPIRRI